MRENETACRTSGVDVTRVKVTLLLISSAIAGAAGSLLAHMNGFISPPTFGWATSVALLMMVVLGGVRSLPGAIVGAAAIRLVVEQTSVLGQQSNIVFGVTLVLFMAFLPNGLAGLAGRLVARPAVGGAARRAVGRAMTEAVLETERVSKRFSGLVAVDAVDLSIARGEMRGIVGPNGAGKTTLFNLVSGLYGVTAGRIRLSGRDVTGGPAARPGGGRPRPHVPDAADLPGAHPFSTMWRSGWPARGRRPCATRSSAAAASGATSWPAAGRGARASCGCPWTSARWLATLNFRASRSAWRSRGRSWATPNRCSSTSRRPASTAARSTCWSSSSARSVARGVTVVLIEHNMKLVMGLCGRISVLDFGRKIAEGTADEVRQNPLVIKAYLGRSAGAGV